MNGKLSQFLDEHVASENELEQRFRYQVAFVSGIAEKMPEYRGQIESAQHKASSALETGAPLAQVLEQFERDLESLQSVCKSYVVHYVGHAHIDMNWQWDWAETVHQSYKTFRTVLRLMDEFPELTFSQSQAVVYWLTEKYAPEIFEQIKAKVKEGRWEITANTWVEGDRNLSSGEALVRHILYSKQYIKDKFGIDYDDIKIDWEPDTFGHAATVPDLLNKAGIKYYYFCRCSVGHPLFWWEGPKGARVLASNKQWYNHSISPEDALEVLPFEERTGLRDHLVVYGVGDHGGGPTRRDILTALRMQQWLLFPTIKFSTCREFFDKAAANGEAIPVYRGELNYVFPGCYTSQSNVKYANRKGENLCGECETYAVLGNKLCDLPYPHDQLTHAWRHVLFNQFHDILPGSGVPATYHYAQGLFQETRAQATMAAMRAKDAMMAAIDTTGEGTPLIVWNPSFWARTDNVTTTLWDIPRNTPKLRLIDAITGAEVPVDIVERGNAWGVDYLGITFTASDVPAVGWRVYHYQPKTEKPVPFAPIIHELKEKSARPVLENRFFRVELSKDNGGLISLYDKSAQLELADPDHPLGVLEYYREAPHGMSSWTIGSLLERVPLAGGTLQKLDWCSKPTYLWQTSYQDSKISVKVSLPLDVPRIDFELNVDWRQYGSPKVGVPGLNVVFPVNLTKALSTREIPFGHIENPDVSHDLPALKWFNVSGQSAERDYSLALLNDCKYGHNFTDGKLRLNLLRSSYDPDPVTEQGQHTVRFSLYPYAGEFDPAKVTRMAFDFNMPLTADQAPTQCGDLAKSFTLLSVGPENVMVSGFKQAENGKGVVLRLYETANQEVDALIRCGFSFKRAYLCDLYERPLKELATDGDAIRLQLQAGELASLYIE